MKKLFEITLGIVTSTPIRVKQRTVMSFQTAKRLLTHLHYAIRRYESVFGEVEIERTLFEASPAQERRQAPGSVHAFAEFVRWPLLQDCERFAIRQSPSAPDYGSSEPVILDAPVSREFDKGRVGEAVDVRP